MKSRRNFFKNLTSVGVGLTVVTNQEAIKVPEVDPRDKLIEELTARAKALEENNKLPFIFNTAGCYYSNYVPMAKDISRKM